MEPPLGIVTDNGNNHCSLEYRCNAICNDFASNPYNRHYDSKLLRNFATNSVFDHHKKSRESPTPAADAGENEIVTHLTKLSSIVKCFSHKWQSTGRPLNQPQATAIIPINGLILTLHPRSECRINLRNYNQLHLYKTSADIHRSS